MRSDRIDRQAGAVLVVMLSLGVLVTTALLVSRLGSMRIDGREREAITARSLADAEEALIAWAVSVPRAAGRRTTPGLLPCPDRNRDGNYDGIGDCVTFGLNASHLLGRLPFAGDARPCPRIGFGIDARDASGERLWYAVSRNLVTGGGGGPVNPDMGAPGKMVHPWIVLRDTDGDEIIDASTGLPLPVAAIVIAPGPALGRQDRRRVAPGPEHYLDRIRIADSTFDNSDSDGCPDAAEPPCASRLYGEEFIVDRGIRGLDGFNDRLAFVTVNELIQAVEKRVLGEVAIVLNGYHSTYGAYPWLAPFSDPVSASYKSARTREGLLALHLPGETFSTGFSLSWNLVDITPSTVARHSGNAAIIPPLADLRSGRIEVTDVDGRCRWSDWTRADCVGTFIVRDYFRRDLGASVTRKVKVDFDLVDATPVVTPPSARDARRRALEVSGSPLTSTKWNIRITDDDGVDRGRRELRVDADTAGAIAVNGIRYDLSTVYDDVDDERDELPEWFAENDWHHFVYAAFSSDAVAGGDVDGDGNCATPVDTCLSLEVDGAVVRTDVRGLLISAGVERAHQDRSIGDCDGDGVGDDFLCAYFEGENGDRSSAARSETYAHDTHGASANDQIRILAPLPP